MRTLAPAVKSLPAEPIKKSSAQSITISLTYYELLTTMEADLTSLHTDYNTIISTYGVTDAATKSALASTAKGLAITKEALIPQLNATPAQLINELSSLEKTLTPPPAFPVLCKNHT
jgi:hypothetical protein